ncbi:hypothetical protein DL96DRAFT_1823265 [Flagelloscypha sp. PMI_526]|nr:hypothetical protein DL96DRAFT_1823265 [Flagelloscypha sp. PMI_526]
MSLRFKPSSTPCTSPQANLNLNLEDLGRALAFRGDMIFALMPSNTKAYGKGRQPPPLAFVATLRTTEFIALGITPRRSNLSVPEDGHDLALSKVSISSLHDLDLLPSFSVRLLRTGQQIFHSYNHLRLPCHEPRVSTLATSDAALTYHAASGIHTIRVLHLTVHMKSFTHPGYTIPIIWANWSSSMVDVPVCFICSSLILD